MEANNTTPLLDCEQVRRLLEEKSTGVSPEALRLHLKSCADCRAELRLRVVMNQMLEEPPAGLADNIMTRIRAEQSKTAARLRFIRRAGAVAAAVVLIPAVVILAPILLRAGNSAVAGDDARIEEIRIPTEAERIPETTAAAADLTEAFLDTSPEAEAPAGEETDAQNKTLAAETEAPQLLFSTAPAETKQKAPAAPADPAPETAPETAAVSAAPSYVGTRETSTSVSDRQTSPSTMASESVTAAPQSELPVFAVLRAMVGEKVVSAHIAAFSGSDADLPAYLCSLFAVKREDFVRQAADMSLSFTDEELDRFFPVSVQ